VTAGPLLGVKKLNGDMSNELDVSLKSITLWP
jgi:hypothetical protein